jgi:hypothetical protein
MKGPNYGEDRKGWISQLGEHQSYLDSINKEADGSLKQSDQVFNIEQSILIRTVIFTKSGNFLRYRYLVSKGQCEIRIEAKMGKQTANESITSEVKTKRCELVRGHQER